MTKFIAILFLATPLFGQGLMPPTLPINTNALTTATGSITYNIEGHVTGISSTQ